MISPTFIRALVYTGLLSNALAILVCFICKEWQPITGKFMNILLWFCSYVLHKKRGTW